MTGVEVAESKKEIAHAVFCYYLQTWLPICHESEKAWLVLCVWSNKVSLVKNLYTNRGTWISKQHPKNFTTFPWFTWGRTTTTL